MSFSLNEIEAEVKKAIRGAGLPWGLAEEGAKASRWLASCGVDPLPSLIDVLDRRAAGDNIATAMTRMDAGRWQAAAPICPILLGATLCDHAHDLATLEFSAGPVARPLLVVPFAARAARALRRSLRFRAEDIEIFLSAEGEALADIRAIDRVNAAVVTCGVGDPPGMAAPLPLRMVAEPLAPSGWLRLSHYAQRTYVPATERSRLEGAGAGAIDND